MNKVRLLILTIVIAALTHSINAQTPQQVVVEHFTNTRCSICASHNPQFYSNLHGNYPQVLHIAYDPSSPYPADTFSILNKTENDDRTKYYGVFGGTPRAVLQGKVIPANNIVVANSYYDSAVNRYAPFKIDIRMEDMANDSMQVTTVVTTTAANSYNVLHLYEVITEDTVFYHAPNGEAVFYDVFHKQLFAGNGLNLTPSATVGDSVVINTTAFIDPKWARTRINVTGLLQDTLSKEVLQSGRQRIIEPASVTTGINTISGDLGFKVYPTPAGSVVHFADDSEKAVAIYNCAGQLLQVYHLQGELDISGLPNGAYILKVMKTDSTTGFTRLVVMH